MALTTLGKVVKTALPLAPPLIDLATRNRGLNSATRTVQAGAGQAGQRIDAASQRAIQEQRDALKKQQGLYDTSVTNRKNLYGQTMQNARDLYDKTLTDQDPYQTLGKVAVGKYSDLLTNPTKFDSATVMQEPGYSYGQDQVQKAVDRKYGSLKNRASLNENTRNLLEYSDQRYQNAFNRYMATQQRQDDLIKGGVGIGQNANAAVQSAGNEYGSRVDAAGNTLGAAVDAAGNVLGNQIGANADKIGSLDVNSAEDQAALDLAASQAQATNQTLGSNNTANTLGKVLDMAPGVINSLKGIAKGAAPLAGTLGAVTGLGGGAAAGTAGGGISAATSSAASTASGGGLGSTLAGLATNPVTIGIAGALAAGAIWLKSQAHWEANTAVKDFENPFHEQTLAPFAAQWDSAIKAGKVNAQQGHDALDQYIQNFQDYSNRILAWGKKGDKNKVAQQSIANLYKTTVKPQIDRMTREIAELPVAA